MSQPRRPTGVWQGAQRTDIRARAPSGGGLRVRLGRFACRALALIGAVLVPCAAAPSLQDGFEASVDALVSDGFERPVKSIRALQQLLHAAPSAVQQRHLLRAIGMVEAGSGQTEAAAAIVQQLRSGRPNALADADADLVQAEIARTAGQLDEAATLAQRALPAFEAACPVEPAAPRGAETAPGGAAGCDYRAAWQLHRLLEVRARSAGVYVTAAAQAGLALRLAERAGDSRRQGTNLASLAGFAQERGERELAQRLLAQARAMAAHTGDLAQRASVSETSARLAAGRGDRPAALAAFQEAFALATRAGTPRRAAQLSISLSDAYERLGRHADALQAAERALVVVRRYKDRTAEQLLVHNAGIAKLGLGRIAEARDDLKRVFDFWDRSGDKGRQASALREYGEALAAAGDARGALDLYHRERDLSDALTRVNREVALNELRSRHDAQARQRDIELRSRDNALMTEALASQDRLQRISWLVAAATLLGCGLVALLYRRVRRVNRQLATNRATLQLQSERDPLTQLSNRRHFEAVVAGLAQPGGGFQGTLLLVDLDHFKRINDAHGHGSGDDVLVAVAQRLNEAVPDGGLVVRWGGEEFLMLLPRPSAEPAAPAAQTAQIAARVLRDIGQTPIVAGGRALAVTGSIGYAHFPLPPHTLQLPWQQAVNLVDLALYHAKTHGRNRAVGIMSAAVAAGVDALHAVEADFAQACTDGRLTLMQTVGPTAQTGARGLVST